MSSNLAYRQLDPTPPRPAEPIDEPGRLLRVSVRVRAAHLANPLLAVQRLLASEAGMFARVTGDDAAFVVAIALADDDESTRRSAEAWVRWVTHVAGVRGDVTVECAD